MYTTMQGVFSSTW